VCERPGEHPGCMKMSISATLLRIAKRRVVSVRKKC
jgi:hypothetical protein